MHIEPTDTMTATRNAIARPLACIECNRRWVVPSERWRLKVTDDEPREAVPYCPDCATREFG